MQDDPFADVPDWLKELQAPPTREELMRSAPLPEVQAPGEVSSEGGGLLEGLREQAVQADREQRRAARRAQATGLRGLAPWQRFVLALLLFLDVALLGCMCLVMTQRVVPFP
jgi:hypothetical protein